MGIIQFFIMPLVNVQPKKIHGISCTFRVRKIYCHHLQGAGTLCRPHYSRGGAKGEGQGGHGHDSPRFGLAPSAPLSVSRTVGHHKTLELLDAANALSLHLQAKDVDLVAAVDLQVLTIELQKRRDNSGTEVDSLFAKTEAVCGENNIPYQPERKHTKDVPAHLRESVIKETIGHVNDINAGTKDTFLTECIPGHYRLLA